MEEKLYAADGTEVYEGSGPIGAACNKIAASCDKIVTACDTIAAMLETMSESRSAGLSDATKALMLSLFEQAAYGNASMQPTLDVLRAEFNSSSGGGTTEPTSYSVVYSLSHVTSSTSVTSVSAGGSFTATLSPASGYTMSSVTVRMGGSDVTASAYNSSTRKISISSVTGTIVITASAASSGSGGSGTIAVTGVALSKTSLSLTVGTSVTLTATVTPSNATDKTVTWTVTPSGYATVSGGVVKAVKAGSCTVTATAGGKSASCSVTVAAAAAAENTNPFPSLTPAYLLPSKLRVSPDAKTYADTGVKLLSSLSPAPEFTILVEFDAAATMQAVKDTYCLLHCMEETKPWPGLSVAFWNTYMGLNMYDRACSASGLTLSVLQESKRRVAVRISGGEAAIRNSVDSSTQHGSFTASTAVDKSLLIGCYQTSDGTKGRFWDGTVYQCVVYQSALTDAQITSWLAG